ncbi:MAG: hypothetical protein ACE15F_08075 [bacterium]
MNHSKWRSPGIRYGCGGCLGLVFLSLFIILTTGFWGYRHYRGFITNLKNYDAASRALRDEYPFSPPQDRVISPERLEEFLNTRDQILLAADRELEYLFDFIKYPHAMRTVTPFSLIKNMTTQVPRIARISGLKIQVLRQAQMNPVEYQFLTRCLAGEVISWRELDAADPRQKTVQLYLQPAVIFEANFEEFEREHPWNGFHGGKEFYQERIIPSARPYLDPRHPNRELISAHADRIASVSCAVYVDLWTWENDF